MFETPYQTTLLNQYDTGKTKRILEEAYIINHRDMKPLVKPDVVKDTELLVLNDPTHTNNIPLFDQPMLINIDPTSSSKETTRFVIDCRKLVSINRGELKVSKPHTYKALVLGGILTQHWYFNGSSRLKSLSKFPVKVFSNWLAMSVTRKLNLDEVAQVRASVIFGYYFLCLFEELATYDAREYLDEDSLYSFALKIGYATGLRTNDVINIIKEIPTMQNVHDLEKALKEFGGSDRFRIFNPAFLYSMTNRTGMFGVTPDTIAAAIEYPPIFYSMIYTAATEKGHQKSEIGSIVHNHRNNNDLQQCVNSLKDIVKYG